jgi:DNA-binding MarR family transcriptional regulator
VTADELLDALAAFRRAVRRASDRPAELQALTGAQLELVRLLRRRPGLAVAEAARELRVAPNTVSTLVSRLAAAGIVVRRADPADRRVGRLDLSPGSRRRVQAWRDRRIDLLEAALAELDTGALQALDEGRQVLERLARTLEEEQA